MANITLNTKVYSGNGVRNGTASYTERTAGVPAGFSDASLEIQMGSGASARVRIYGKLNLPVIAAEASTCACPGQVLRRADANLNIRIDPTMTAAERTDFGLRLKDWVASPEFQASIASLLLPAG